jgi:hypothetical protein
MKLQSYVKQVNKLSYLNTTVLCHSYVFLCLLFAVLEFLCVFLLVEQMARGIQEKRLQEVKQYQTLLTDLEQWLTTVYASLHTEHPTSPQAIKDQLVAHEVSKCLL